MPVEIFNKRERATSVAEGDVVCFLADGSDAVFYRVHTARPVFEDLSVGMAILRWGVGIDRAVVGMDCALELVSQMTCDEERFDALAARLKKNTVYHVDDESISRDLLLLDEYVVLSDLLLDPAAAPDGAAPPRWRLRPDFVRFNTPPRDVVEEWCTHASEIIFYAVATTVNVFILYHAAVAFRVMPPLFDSPASFVGIVRDMYTTPADLNLHCVPRRG